MSDAQTVCEEIYDKVEHGQLRAAVRLLEQWGLKTASDARIELEKAKFELEKAKFDLK